MYQNVYGSNIQGSPYSGYDCCYPVAGHGYCGFGRGRNFTLIIVLFILLIIVGACWSF
ncbi:YjcZ family sporulation protein [Peribacillus glennii]|uniref:YjcZ family sporulation protein n=1 Tax=Peribacillus glennii TaxID=2303991 RepID=A0A372LDZ7_9BACI|nr:YjcZ family sporulation protein [Peribacillus glennii]RFU63435.1 YjcZ family sporulation protein [Peribacillus glennii]